MKELLAKGGEPQTTTEKWPSEEAKKDSAEARSIPARPGEGRSGAVLVAITKALIDEQSVSLCDEPAANSKSEVDR